MGSLYPIFDLVGRIFMALLFIPAGAGKISGYAGTQVSFLLAGFCLVAALLFHLQPDDQMQMILLTKNVAIAGGLLFLVANGAGAFSIDRWRQKS